MSPKVNSSPSSDNVGSMFSADIKYSPPSIFARLSYPILLFRTTLRSGTAPSESVWSLSFKKRVPLGRKL
uniref:Uncharacterized protein n=1 Tax=Anguilla anguilla TaxID=7936 RepID=A0A0E9PHW6_ANGAN